ncbi:MAG: protein-glutamate O-methyltransferase [Deltaproteobacteria bacterium]|nr:protein-glutamate O-methyltransferase [Deltaproteobacteria bacterium]
MDGISTSTSAYYDYASSASSQTFPNPLPGSSSQPANNTGKSSPSPVPDPTTSSKSGQTDPLTGKKKAAPEEQKKGSSSGQLSAKDQQVVEQLRKRDQEVRTHEQAHMAAAGAYATSGATYTYETGPDGQRYAVGGEVSIDTSPVKGDPAATIMKMETVQRAALAPANPSGQDQKVAAAAAAKAQSARVELLRKQMDSSSQGAQMAHESSPTASTAKTGTSKIATETPKTKTSPSPTSPSSAAGQSGTGSRSNFAPSSDLSSGAGIYNRLASLIPTGSLINQMV